MRAESGAPGNLEAAPGPTGPGLSDSGLSDSGPMLAGEAPLVVADGALPMTAKRAWLAWCGAWLSALCALHCVLVPILFALLPALKLALYSVRDPNHGVAMALLWSMRYERALVLSGLLLCGLGILLQGAPSARVVWLYSVAAGASVAALSIGQGSLIGHFCLSAFAAIALLLATRIQSRACCAARQHD